MTIAEAYSYGVPVIAGRVGNMDGMVQEGVTGKPRAMVRCFGV